MSKLSKDDLCAKRKVQHKSRNAKRKADREKQEADDKQASYYKARGLSEITKEFICDFADEESAGKTISCNMVGSEYTNDLLALAENHASQERPLNNQNLIHYKLMIRAATAALDDDLFLLLESEREKPLLERRTSVYIKPED